MSKGNLFRQLFSVIIMTVFVSANCGFTVFAEKTAVSDPVDVWHIGYDLNKKSDFSISYDSKDKSKYVIKIENKDYNDTFIQRTYSVKPNTQYKFSALVKYEGYKGDPNGAFETGANLGKRTSKLINCSNSVRDNKWTSLEYTFNSGSDCEIKMLLRNGFHKANCKGTAYFSDIKLEEIIEGKPTNEWNVLAVIVKNIDAPAVTTEGKEIHVKVSLSDDAIKKEKKIVKRMKNSFPEWSDNQIKIKNLDIVLMTETIKSFSESSHWGYTIDSETPQVQKFLSKYVNEKKYDQIIIISPLLGYRVTSVGGYNNTIVSESKSKYNGAHVACTFIWADASVGAYLKNVPEIGMVHEMIHSIQQNSIGYNGSNTPDLDAYKKYGYKADDENGYSTYTWNRDYLRSSKKPFKDGKGLDPRAFYVSHDTKYKNITGKMKVDDKIKVV